jgi:triosephosphate isomerase (TIM)
LKNYLIAGNWKMNLTPTEAKDFAKKLSDSIKNLPSDVIVMIAPPFTALAGVKEVIKNSVIKLGAQNVNENEKGAFTGEVSANMLLDIGVEYVIIGHSERRHIYKENDELINKKVLFALKKGLKPILCVGELLEEREKGLTESIVKNQVINGLKNVEKNSLEKVVIAYEPVWAIGTGKVATPEIAEDVHLLIRNTLNDLYDKNSAENMTIQYGGSVKADNVDGLMKKPDIDGALVGGAALELDSFVRIVNFKK